jgi:hypothetical protein
MKKKPEEEEKKQEPADKYKTLLMSCAKSNS